MNRKNVLSRSGWSGFALASALIAASCGRPQTGAPVTPAPGPVGPASPGPESSAADPAAPAVAEVKPPELRLGDEARPVGYQLDITLVPEKETFAGAVAIDIELSRAVPVLWLNASALTVESATAVIGGEERALRVIPGGSDFVGFAAEEAMSPGRFTLKVRYRGLLPSQDYGGLFRQNEGDDWYIYTQFEPFDARRAFPSFDEPRFKVPYQLTLHVKKEHLAVANTPIESETEGADGMKTVRFQPTKPLPSYLVAMAVGPFEVVDAGRAGRNKTPIRIITPRGKSAGAAYAAEATGPILTLLENYFDTPYPYEKLDQIALPTFLGAMENPGLVTYHMDGLLAMPGEDHPQRQRGFASTCAHELAHMWFGDLVTMKWWDDIWLNESFATWMSAKILRQWKPEWEGDKYAVTYANGAMHSDSLASARKIRQPIVSAHDIRSAFDGITYGKGAAVLRMFEAWIGEDKFRQGIRNYVRKHAYKNADARDFFDALGEVGGGDVASAFETFVEQPGVPLVRAELSCEGKNTPKLLLSQQRYAPAGSRIDTAKHWKVPVCVEYGVGRKSHRQCTLMSGEKAEIALESAKQCPSWVLPNDAMSGYYRVEYSGDMLARLLGKAKKKLTVAERLGVIYDMEAMMKAGKLGRGEALAWVPKLVGSRDRHIIGSTLNMASLSERLVPENLEPNYARFLRKMYGKRARKLGWRVRKGEGDDTRLLRPRLLGLIAYKGDDRKLVSQARKLAEKWLGDRKAVDPELVGTVLAVAVKDGDAALWQRFYDQAKASKDSKERRQLLRGMAGFESPEVVEKNLALTLTDEFRMIEMSGFLWGGLSRAKTRVKTFEFLKKHFDSLLARMPRWSSANLAYMAGVFCSTEEARQAEAFFKPRVDRIAGGPRALAQSLERVRLCAARRDLDRANVAEFLKKY